MWRPTSLGGWTSTTHSIIITYTSAVHLSQLLLLLMVWTDEDVQYVAGGGAV